MHVLTQCLWVLIDEPHVFGNHQASDAHTAVNGLTYVIKYIINRGYFTFYVQYDLYLIE